MNQYLLLFRRDAEVKFSPEQLQKMTQPWMDWMGSVAAQNKLANQGNRLDSAGKVVRPNNVVTNGPYVEMKEAIGGYTIVKTNSLDEAVEVAKGCPILNVGGTVEVRQIVAVE